MSTENLLEVRRLKTYFKQEDRIFRAVDGVDFSIQGGEILGIVGESGCGKSVTSLSIMQLLSEKGFIAGGEIRLNGQNLLELTDEQMNDVRGKSIAMIFQDPMVSLNPVYSVGEQISEAIRSHTKLTKKEAMDIALEMLKKVGIPSAERRINEYPHQLSGGMRQRVMIAMALCLNPQLLIADEPTTALDVTIQAQILNLIREMNRSTGMSVLMITHDLGVIAELCDRVIVMYAGRIVESSDVKNLFAHPMHPYTCGLMQAIPRLDQNSSDEGLFAIPGIVPSPDKFPAGCRFADRCRYARETCRQTLPELQEIAPGHMVACVGASELKLGQSEGVCADAQ